MTARADPEQINQAREENTRVLFRNFLPEPGDRAPADDVTVRAELCQCRGEHIWARVEEALKGRPLTPRQKGLIQLARHVVRDYFTQPAFHPELGRALLSESGGLMASALTSDSWVLPGSDQPVPELLTLVGRVALGWSPNDRRAPRARDLLCSWLRALSQGEDPDRVVAAARRRLAELDRVRDQRVAAVLNQQGMSAAEARRLAAQRINRQLAGRRLPPFLGRSLHRDWWPALQQILREEGESSELGNRLTRVLGLVIWALQPHDTDALPLRKFNRVAEEVCRELPLVLAQVMPELERREALVDRIEVALYSVIHGRQVERQVVDELEPHEPEDDESAASAQWFERASDGQRIWLAGADTDASRMAFDFFGRRILHCSPAEWTGLLQSGEIRPVAEPVEPARLIERHLERLKRREQARKARAG